MITVASIAAFLETFAPTRLAAEWDNVGLLVGNANQNVERMMTCLTVAQSSVAEAMAEKADLIVTHHPFPFHPLRRLTSETAEGRSLLDLIAAQIAVYSPHTAFDSARLGINQQLAECLGLTDVGPLIADSVDPAIGTGRFGYPASAVALGDIAKNLKDFLNLRGLHIVGNPQVPIRAVAVACGSAGELLDAAHRAKCDLFVTGEARFHTCLEAQALGMSMILTGHFASERFAVKYLSDLLGSEFPGITSWACRSESDPLQWV